MSTARDFELTLSEVPSDPVDETFCDFLFAGDEAVRLNELKPNEGQRKDLQDWWEQVAKGARAPLSGGGRFETRILWWLAWTSPLWGLTLAFLGDLRPGLAWLVVLEAFVLAYVAHRAVPRRLAGASDREHLARWSAFRRFLRRFSSLPDAPAAAVIIWEQYLVFAAALGVADLVERQVRAIVPVQTLPAPWPGAPSGLYAMQAYRTFQSISFSALAVTASGSPSTGSSGSSGSTSFSSSSGSGGGFSSGGGGGGGGTGGGAG